MLKESSTRPIRESDVAKLAGVSQSAVSRAFTPGASIAEKTRQKVLEAAEELGYHPNLLARSLATNRSNIVALAISYLENPFYAQMVKELSERLRETDRHILLFTAPDGNQADPALERVLSYQVDALILTATKASEELTQKCVKAGIPIIQINRESDLKGISTVRGQNRRAGEKAGEHLLSAGHKRFGFIGGSEGSSTSRIREHGFVDYLKSRGVTDIKVAYGNYTFEAATLAARDFLQGSDRPDAIFCASDYMAFAVLEVAKNEFGLRIPEDLSVIGFDNVPEAAHMAYNLTTFSQPAAALAEVAVRVVGEMIANPKQQARRYEVPGELIVRGTARTPLS